MVRGYDKHHDRLAALSALGRPLARRAGARCELCSSSGETLVMYEVAPVPEEPELERTLFLCTTCSEGLAGSKKVDPNHWHCLRESIWSDTPAVQVVAVRKLRTIAADPLAVWADEALEVLHLEPEVAAWIEAASL